MSSYSTARHFLARAVMLVFLLSGSLLVHADQQQDSIPQGILPIDKQNLLKNVNIIFNMRAAANAYTNADGFNSARIQMEQFRLEFKGNLTERLFFRFRDRYTKTPTAESADNFSRATDMAYVEYQMLKDSKSWYMSIGKMGAGWGGYEFKANPIDIYQYGDLIANSENFLTGINSRVNLNAHHSLSFSVLNSRTRQAEEIYPNEGPDFKRSKAPLGYVVNYQASALEGKIQTICAHGLFSEAEGYYVNYTTLGLQLQPCKKLEVQFDYKLSNEQIDREGVISKYIAGGDAYDKRIAKSGSYRNYWTHIAYHINPQVNVFVYAFTDQARWKGANDYYANATGHQKIYDTYCYIPGVEYAPISKYNFKLFASYVGYSYKFSDFAKTTLKSNNFSNNRFSIGIISPLVFL